MQSQAANDALTPITRRGRRVAVCEHTEPEHRLSGGWREGWGQLCEAGSVKEPSTLGSGSCWGERELALDSICLG